MSFSTLYEVSASEAVAPESKIRHDCVIGKVWPLQIPKLGD